VDDRAHDLGLIRSRYVAYVIKKDIDGKNRYRNRDIVMFSIVLLTFLAILLNIIGVF
jgi:hypothetical protein